MPYKIIPRYGIGAIYRVDINSTLTSTRKTPQTRTLQIFVKLSINNHIVGLVHKKHTGIVNEI